MTGNIWMCSHLLDEEDLEFGKHEFITYKMGEQYYGMGNRRFANLAWGCGAVYKCGKLVLIRRDILEAHMRERYEKEKADECEKNENADHECRQIQRNEGHDKEVSVCQRGRRAL